MQMYQFPWRHQGPTKNLTKTFWIRLFLSTGHWMHGQYSNFKKAKISENRTWVEVTVVKAVKWSACLTGFWKDQVSNKLFSGTFFLTRCGMQHPTKLPDIISMRHAFYCLSKLRFEKIRTNLLSNRNLFQFTSLSLRPKQIMDNRCDWNSVFGIPGINSWP